MLNILDLVQQNAVFPSRDFIIKNGTFKNFLTQNELHCKKTDSERIQNSIGVAFEFDIKEFKFKLKTLLQNSFFLDSLQSILLCFPGKSISNVCFVFFNFENENDNVISFVLFIFKRENLEFEKKNFDSKNCSLPSVECLFSSENAVKPNEILRIL